MPISVEWSDNSQQIIFFTITADWTLEDFLMGKNEANAMVQSVGHPVDIIANALDSGGLPPETNMLPHLADIFKEFPARYIVLVGGSQFGRATVEMLTRKFKMRSRTMTFANTLEDAHEKLKQLKDRDTRHDPRPF